MCAKLIAIIALMIIGAAGAGCRKPQGDELTFGLAISPDIQVEEDGLDSAARRLHAEKILAVSTTGSHYKFLVAYHYRGTSIPSVYGYEEVEPGLWALRACYPFIRTEYGLKGQDLVVTVRPDADSVQILYGDKVYAVLVDTRAHGEGAGAISTNGEQAGAPGAKTP